MNPKSDLDKGIAYLQLYKLEGCQNYKHFILAIDYLKKHHKNHRRIKQNEG